MPKPLSRPILTLALLATFGATQPACQAADATPPAPTATALPVPPAPAKDGILAEADALPKLPAAITSFGAAVAGDWVYVYGGHIGKTHEHSRENLAKNFVRLDLRLDKTKATWETLPMGPLLQGLALVGWQDKVIRIGGVDVKNGPTEKDDMHSIADVELYDPQTKAWQPLTPLPEGRSSHDAVILNDHLYVIGGWRMTGHSDDAEWSKQNYVADLRVSPIRWELLPVASFRQRALAVAATDQRIYAIGGLSEDDEPCNAVQIYDPVAKTWTRGPDFPAPDMPAAFAVSAYGIGKTIWASAAAGKLFALGESDGTWRDTGRRLVTPRFFHRLLPASGSRLLFIAGASRQAHRDDTESVPLDALLSTPLDKFPIATAEKKSAQAQQPAVHQ